MMSEIASKALRMDHSSFDVTLFANQDKPFFVALVAIKSMPRTITFIFLIWNPKKSPKHCKYRFAKSFLFLTMNFSQQILRFVYKKKTLPSGSVI